MLQAAIEQLGGDPTAVTPSANLQATAAHGIQKVVVDPRTTLLQLEAALVAELTDNACWEALIELAQEAGRMLSSSNSRRHSRTSRTTWKKSRPG